MATRQGRLVLSILMVVVAASLWRVSSTEYERHRLASGYGRLQGMVGELRGERDGLTTELSGARQALEERDARIANMERELTALQGKLQHAETELTGLRTEYEQLRQLHASLTGEFQVASAQRDELEAKFASITALKEAIRDLKRQARRERWEVWLARIRQLQAEDQQRLAQGNRGYVVRDGASTLGSSGRRLRVHVLEPHSP